MGGKKWLRGDFAIVLAGRGVALQFGWSRCRGNPCGCGGWWWLPRFVVVASVCGGCLGSWWLPRFVVVAAWQGAHEGRPYVQTA